MPDNNTYFYNNGDTYGIGSLGDFSTGTQKKSDKGPGIPTHNKRYKLDDINSLIGTWSSKKPPTELYKFNDIKNDYNYYVKNLWEQVKANNGEWDDNLKAQGQALQNIYNKIPVEIRGTGEKDPKTGKKDLHYFSPPPVKPLTKSEKQQKAYQELMDIAQSATNTTAKNLANNYGYFSTLSGWKKKFYNPATYAAETGWDPTKQEYNKMKLKIGIGAGRIHVTQNGDIYRYVSKELPDGSVKWYSELKPVAHIAVNGTIIPYTDPFSGLRKWINDAKRVNRDIESRYPNQLPMSARQRSMVNFQAPPFFSYLSSTLFGTRDAADPAPEYMPSNKWNYTTNKEDYAFSPQQQRMNRSGAYVGSNPNNAGVLEEIGRQLYNTGKGVYDLITGQQPSVALNPGTQYTANGGAWVIPPAGEAQIAASKQRAAPYWDIPRTVAEFTGMTAIPYVGKPLVYGIGASPLGNANVTESPTQAIIDAAINEALFGLYGGMGKLIPGVEGGGIAKNLFPAAKRIAAGTTIGALGTAGHGVAAGKTPGEAVAEALKPRNLAQNAATMLGFEAGGALASPFHRGQNTAEVLRMPEAEPPALPPYISPSGRDTHARDITPNPPHITYMGAGAGQKASTAVDLGDGVQATAIKKDIAADGGQKVGAELQFTNQAGDVHNFKTMIAVDPKTGKVKITMQDGEGNGGSQEFNNINAVPPWVQNLVSFDPLSMSKNKAQQETSQVSKGAELPPIPPETTGEAQTPPPVQETVTQPPVQEAPPTTETPQMPREISPAKPISRGPIKIPTKEEYKNLSPQEKQDLTKRLEQRLKVLEEKFKAIQQNQQKRQPLPKTVGKPAPVPTTTEGVQAAQGASTGAMPKEAGTTTQSPDIVKPAYNELVKKMKKQRQQKQSVTKATGEPTTQAAQGAEGATLPPPMPETITPSKPALKKGPKLPKTGTQPKGIESLIEELPANPQTGTQPKGIESLIEELPANPPVKEKKKVAVPTTVGKQPQVLPENVGEPATTPKVKMSEAEKAQAEADKQVAEILKNLPEPVDTGVNPPDLSNITPENPPSETGGNKTNLPTTPEKITQGEVNKYIKENKFNVPHLANTFYTYNGRQWKLTGDVENGMLPTTTNGMEIPIKDISHKDILKRIKDGAKANIIKRNKAKNRAAGKGGKAETVENKKGSGTNTDVQSIDISNKRFPGRSTINRIKKILPEIPDKDWKRSKNNPNIEIISPSSFEKVGIKLPERGAKIDGKLYKITSILRETDENGNATYKANIKPKSTKKTTVTTTKKKSSGKPQVHKSAITPAAIPLLLAGDPTGHLLGLGLLGAGIYKTIKYVRANRTQGKTFTDIPNTRRYQELRKNGHSQEEAIKIVQDERNAWKDVGTGGGPWSQTNRKAEQSQENRSGTAIEVGKWVEDIKATNNKINEIEPSVLSLVSDVLRKIREDLYATKRLPKSEQADAKAKINNDKTRRITVAAEEAGLAPSDALNAANLIEEQMKEAMKLNIISEILIESKVKLEDIPATLKEYKKELYGDDGNGGLTADYKKAKKQKQAFKNRLASLSRWTYGYRAKIKTRTGYLTEIRDIAKKTGDTKLENAANTLLDYMNGKDNKDINVGGITLKGKGISKKEFNAAKKTIMKRWQEVWKAWAKKAETAKNKIIPLKFFVDGIENIDETVNQIWNNEMPLPKTFNIAGRDHGFIIRPVVRGEDGTIKSANLKETDSKYFGWYKNAKGRDIAADKLLKDKGFNPVQGSDGIYYNPDTGEYVKRIDLYGPEADYRSRLLRRIKPDIDAVIRRMMRGEKVSNSGLEDVINKVGELAVDDENANIKDDLIKLKNALIDAEKNELSIDDIINAYNNFTLRPTTFQAYQDKSYGENPKFDQSKDKLSLNQAAEDATNKFENTAMINTLRKELDELEALGMGSTDYAENIRDIINSMNGMVEPKKGYFYFRIPGYGGVPIRYADIAQDAMSIALYLPTFLYNVGAGVSNIIYAAYLTPQNRYWAGDGLMKSTWAMFKALSGTRTSNAIMAREITHDMLNFVKWIAKGDNINDPVQFSTKAKKIIKDPYMQKALDYSLNSGMLTSSAGGIGPGVKGSKISKGGRIGTINRIMENAMLIQKVTETRNKMIAWETEVTKLRKESSPESMGMTSKQYIQWLGKKGLAAAGRATGYYNSVDLGPMVRRISQSPIGRHVLALLKPAVFQFFRTLRLLGTAFKEGRAPKERIGQISAAAFATILLIGLDKSPIGGMGKAYDEIAKWLQGDDAKLLKHSPYENNIRKAQLLIAKMAKSLGASDEDAQSMARDIMAFIRDGALSEITGRAIAPDVTIGSYAEPFALQFAQTYKQLKNIAVNGFSPKSIRLLGTEPKRVVTAIRNLYRGHRLIPYGTHWQDTKEPYNFGKFVGDLIKSPLKNTKASTQVYMEGFEFVTANGRRNFYKKMGMNIGVPKAKADDFAEKIANGNPRYNYAEHDFEQMSDIFNGKYASSAVADVARIETLFDNNPDFESAYTLTKSVSNDDLKNVLNGGVVSDAETEAEIMYAKTKETSIARKLMENWAWEFYEKMAIYDVLNSHFGELGTELKTNEMEDFKGIISKAKKAGVSPGYYYAILKAKKNLKGKTK